MKTAVIYARYSSDNQTEQSIEGQLRVCQDYAKRNDILILNTYIDRAMTGTNDNRPDFQQMIKDSNNRDFQNIIVYKIDRFSRNKYETAKYKKILKDNGVKLLSAMENIPDTPEGIILESLLEGMAEYYSAELAQKVKRGQYETRLKGLYPGGSIPYGYKLEDRRFVIDEEKAEVIRYIYNQYSRGIFVNEIVKTLTEKGILHYNRPFIPNTVYKILKNEKYIGIYRKGKEVHTNTFPKIIEPELFERVKSSRKINQYGKKPKTNFLLKNKIKCGYCGKPISAESGKSQNGTIINYYKCVGIKKYRNGCIKETLRKEVLETFITETIINELHKPKTIDIIVKNLMELQNNTSDLNSTLNTLIKGKKQAELTLNNIMKAVEQGIVNKTTGRRMRELEEQIEEYEKSILIEKCKANTIVNEEEIKLYYKEALKKEPESLIAYLIKEIKLFNDKIEIKFNSPITKSPDNNQGFFILSTIKELFRIINKQVTTTQIKIELYV